MPAPMTNVCVANRSYANFSIFSCLSGFRPEFAVADAGANFHLRPDCVIVRVVPIITILVNAREYCKEAIVDASLAERCSRDALPLRKLAGAPNFFKLLC